VIVDNASGLENVQEGVDTAGGNSGSPLVNQCGDVVALRYSGSVAEVKVSGKDATVDTSKYNFAISDREVTKFLKDAGISSHPQRLLAGARNVTPAARASRR